MGLPKDWRALLRPAAWAWERWRHPRGRLVRVNGRWALRVDPSCALGRGREVCYEPKVLAPFLRSIRPGATVLDVGANMGVFSVLAARKAGSTGRVIACEAAPAALQVLGRQLALNGVGERVRVVAALAGAAHGELVPFHAADEAVGWASAAYAPPGTRELQVPTVSVDALARRYGAPHVIKIDVEGFELEVLRGAGATLRDARPRIFCALHPDFLEARGQSADAALQHMQEAGYATQWLTDEEVCFLPE